MASFSVPMAVIVAVEFDRGETVKIPVAVPVDATVHHLVTQLNRRLGGILDPLIQSTTEDPHLRHIDVRLTSGEPVRDWSTKLSDVGVSPQQNAVNVIAECPLPANLPHTLRHRVPMYSNNNTNAPGPGVHSIGAAPANENQPATHMEHDEEEEEDVLEAVTPNPGIKLRAMDALTPLDALHFLQMDGAIRKVFSKIAVPMRGVVCYERPKLSTAYPTELVETVRRDAILRTRFHDPDAATIPSTITGVSDSEFTTFLSIAQAYGRTVYTNTRYNKQLAFHIHLLAIPHCCRPSCSKAMNPRRPPFTAVLRCATASVLNQGDEVTVLYDWVDRPEFMLLPADRRQKILRNRYHFTCRCDRCMKSGAGPATQGNETSCTASQLTSMTTAEKEATLSGAFWKDSNLTHAQRKVLTEAMRAEFAALGISSSEEDCSFLLPNATLSQVDPQPILEFVKKYHMNENGPLILHRHHWRLNLARMAYLRRLVGRGIAKDCLTRESYTIAIHQLAAESFFIPDGHPHALVTYRYYKRLVALLPSNLAAQVQKEVRETVARDWSIIRRLDELVSSRDNKSVPSGAMKEA